MVQFILWTAQLYRRVNFFYVRLDKEGKGDFFSVQFDDELCLSNMDRVIHHSRMVPGKVDVLFVRIS